MSRKKTGQYDHKAYQNDYHKAMKTKLISFNPSNAEDMFLWEHLQKKKNVTAYIKDLIREDIDSREQQWLFLCWLARFCRHIDNGDRWLTDEENFEFFKEKMKQQHGWNTDGMTLESF